MSERTCSIDGCDRPVAARGWCKTHHNRWRRTGDPGAAVPIVTHRKNAPGSQCAVEGCDKAPDTRGWCHTHYSRWKRAGDVGADVPVTPHLPEHASDATCAIECCERPVKGGSRGWCHAHFERWRKHGDVKANVPLGSRIDRVSPGTPCAVEGCEKPVKSGGRGWCGMHYARWRAHGDPLVVLNAWPMVCAVDGCDEKPTARGLCATHYSRLRRRGDPLVAERPKLPNAKVSYYLFHARLREARGSASEHQCDRCDRRAVQWAYVHGEDPRDFASYVPMCPLCHKRYDQHPEVPQDAARGSVAAWGRRGAS